MAFIFLLTFSIFSRFFTISKYNCFKIENNFFKLKVFLQLIVSYVPNTLKFLKSLVLLVNGVKSFSCCQSQNLNLVGDSWDSL